MLVSVVRALVAVVAVAAVLAAPAPAFAAAPASDAHAVRLHRPAKVGDKFAYSADATVVQTMTVNNSGQIKTLQTRSIAVHFEGTEHVLAVNARGEPTRAEYVVAECTSREGKQNLTVIQPGRLVTVEAGKWQSRIDVDQGAFTIQDELVARSVLSLTSTDHPGDDECFGTDKPAKPGESWPVRADGLVRAYANAPGLKVKKQNVSGTIKLAGIETVDGTACMKVQGKTKIEHFFPPATDLPEHSRLQDATMEYKFTKLLPLDPAGQCLMDSHSTNLQLKLRVDDASIGSDIPVEGKLLRTVGIRRKPLK